MARRRSAGGYAPDLPELTYRQVGYMVAAVDDDAGLVGEPTDEIKFGIAGSGVKCELRLVHRFNARKLPGSLWTPWFYVTAGTYAPDTVRVGDTVDLSLAQCRSHPAGDNSNPYPVVGRATPGAMRFTVAEVDTDLQGLDDTDCHPAPLPDKWAFRFRIEETDALKAWMGVYWTNTGGSAVGAFSHLSYTGLFGNQNIGQGSGHRQDDGENLTYSDRVTAYGAGQTLILSTGVSGASLASQSLADVPLMRNVAMVVVRNGKALLPQGVELNWRLDNDQIQRADRFIVYKRTGSQYGFIGYTEERYDRHTGPSGLTTEKWSRFLDDGIEPDLTLPPPSRVPPWVTGSISDARERRLWPGLVSRIQQRYVFGASRAHARTLFFSSPGPTIDFIKSDPPVASDAFERQLDSPRALDVRHIIPSAPLLVLTSYGEWMVFGSVDQNIDPQTTAARLGSTIGCNHIVPVQAFNKTLFVNNDSNQIYMVEPEYEDTNFEVAELSRLFTEVLAGRQIQDMAWSPEARLLALAYKDGSPEMGIVTFDHDQRIVAYADQKLGVGSLQSVEFVNEKVGDTTMPVLYATRTAAGQFQLLRMRTEHYAGQTYADLGVPYASIVETFPLPAQDETRDDLTEYDMMPSRALVECAGAQHLQMGMSGWLDDPYKCEQASGLQRWYGETRPARRASVSVKHRAFDEPCTIFAVGVQLTSEDRVESDLEILRPFGMKAWVTRDRERVLVQTPDGVQELTRLCRDRVFPGKIVDWTWCARARFFILVFDEGSWGTFTWDPDLGTLAFALQTHAGLGIAQAECLMEEGIEQVYMIRKANNVLLKWPTEREGATTWTSRRSCVCSFDNRPEGYPPLYGTVNGITLEMVSGNTDGLKAGVPSFGSQFPAKLSPVPRAALPVDDGKLIIRTQAGSEPFYGATVVYHDQAQDIELFSVTTEYEPSEDVETGGGRKG